MEKVGEDLGVSEDEKNEMFDKFFEEKLGTVEIVFVKPITQFCRNRKVEQATICNDTAAMALSPGAQ